MQNVFGNNPPSPILIVALLILAIWQLFWKGVALWRASNSQQRNWFLALFVLMPLNDVGIVEIIYMFWFAKKRLTFTELKSWFVKKV